VSPSPRRPSSPKSPAKAAAAARPGSAAAGKPSTWLLLGPEAGQKEEFLKELASGLGGAGGGEPEVHRFYAFEAKMADVVRCLRNQSLFASRRLVIVAEADRVKRAEEVAALVEYIGNPAQDAALVLESSENPREMDKRISAAVPKENQRVFWELFDNQKKGWVVSFFRQRKISVDPAAVEALLDMVENNTRDMRSECERLALYFGPGAAIEADSIEKFIAHSKEESVFTLFDAMARRELAACEEILEKILLSREAEAAQLAGGLLWQFRNLARLKRLLAENYELTEACTKLRITSRKNQKTYGEAAQGFSAPEVESVLLCLHGFEERMRSFKSDLHPLLLRMMVYYIVQRAGRGAWRAPPLPGPA
jgi:DNA polymerase III subunit delta